MRRVQAAFRNAGQVRIGRLHNEKFSEGKRPRGRSPTRDEKIKFGPLLSNRQNGLQQNTMETVYQREVEMSPGPRSSVMKERPERERSV
ncbi:jg794 [Pararge aegeria aegeria]|uniref:Jg794 protein n=1 Tax=Pararge aegeria aegeria TaxID=348720 RepID=A0A8S4QMY8_9NEOP|nr:jg794 [Pararge aegeria aegeria]